MNTTAPYTNHGFPTVQWVLVTPELAEQWLEDFNKRNRSKRPAHVANIARDISDGKFLITGDTIKFSKTGRLIDGQHRLSAIAKAGKPIWVLVVTELSSDVQIVIDAGAKRSGGDAVRFKQLGGESNIIAAAARIGIARELGRLTLTTDRANASPTNSEVLEWAARNPDIVEASSAICGMRKHIPMRPAVLAYTYMTFARIDADAAFNFFDSIASMRTTGKGDPRLALVRFLESESEHHPEQKIGAQLFAATVAWNAWRKGNPMHRIIILSRETDARGNRLGREIPPAV